MNVKILVVLVTVSLVTVIGASIASKSVFGLFGKNNIQEILSPSANKTDNNQSEVLGESELRSQTIETAIEDQTPTTVPTASVSSPTPTNTSTLAPTSILTSTLKPQTNTTAPSPTPTPFTTSSLTAPNPTSKPAAQNITITPTSNSTPTPTTTPTPIITPRENTYSDYIFGYTYANEYPQPSWMKLLRFSETSRDLRLTRALFRISDEDAEKYDSIDRNRYSPDAILNFCQHQCQSYTLERMDNNTFLYVGSRSSGIPIAKGYVYTLISIPTFAEGRITNISLPMSEWEIWDNTTGKPVKTQ